MNCNKTDYNMNISHSKNKPLSRVKKTKKKKSKIDKQKLWNKFDSIQENEIKNNNKKIECVYDSNNDNQLSTSRECCDRCQSSLVITHEGFMLCTNNKCAIVYKDTVDQSAEWRYYGADDSSSSDPTRCGMPINPLLKESSYSCKVVCGRGSSSRNYEMQKLSKYTDWISMPHREKARYDEFEHIKIMANHSGIPKCIVDDALYFHKIISEEKTFRALNREGIIAASIYISGRLNSYPRTAREIATMFHLDNTNATRGCKNALTILNRLEKDKKTENKTVLCETKPISFIERYCSRLNMNPQSIKLCQFIALFVDKNNLIPENTPHSIAAGIIYFISNYCNLGITKKSINNISGISEVTINKCSKKLEQIEEQIIPKPIREKYRR